MWIRQSEQVKQQVTPTIKNVMLTYHNGMKQAVAESKKLEYVSVGEKLTLRL